MLRDITKCLSLNRHGVSNVIVVMLGLVLIVIVVANVVLWSQQMNQLDMKKMQEILRIDNITRITRSLWFTVQNEYVLSVGSRVNGTYFDTKILGGSCETFREEEMNAGIYRSNASNGLLIDLLTCPLAYVHGLEILVRYNATFSEERWFVKAFNWTESVFSDLCFNSTQGSQPVLSNWNDYTINVTSDWQDYVRNDGTVLIEFFDEGLNSTQTVVGVDFIGVRAIVDGTRFHLENSGPLTTCIIAIWIENATLHQRYTADLYINSAEEVAYIRVDISLPKSGVVVKAVTERGNIAVFRQ